MARYVKTFAERSPSGQAKYARTAKVLGISVPELDRRRAHLSERERALLNGHTARYEKTAPTREARRQTERAKEAVQRQRKPSFRAPSAINRNRYRRDVWTKARDEFKARALDGMSPAQYRRENGEDALLEQQWSARDLLSQYERWLPAAEIKSNGEPTVSPDQFADWAEQEGPDAVNEVIDKMIEMRDARIAGTPLPGTAYHQSIKSDYDLYGYSTRRYNRFR